MANVKRPSKSVIVNKALDFVFDAQVRDKTPDSVPRKSLTVDVQVKEHALVKENNDLRLQVDQLRARLGMAPLPPPEPLIAAVNITNTKSRSRSFEHFSRSFSSADGTFEDKANSMSGSMRHDSIVESPSSDLHSPGSIYSPQVAMPSPPLTDGNSPVLSFPPTTLFQTLDMASSTPSEGSHDGSRSLPTPSPFLPHAPQQQSHLLPGMGQQQSSAMLQSPFGYMNPSLLAQQHSLLIAAYANQQQQQAQFQHAHQQQQQQQQQHQLHAHHHSMQHGGQGQMQDMYGMSSGQQTGGGGAGGGMNWSVFGGAAGPMDTYSFMS